MIIQTLIIIALNENSDERYKSYFKKLISNLSAVVLRANCYSVLRLFIGFILAALMAWKIMVNSAMIVVDSPAAKNTHPFIFIRYAKPCNQLFMDNHATGKAISAAMATSFIKSFEISITICIALAPSTFLIPISLARCTVMYPARANNPRQAKKIASVEKVLNILAVCRSL